MYLAAMLVQSVTGALAARAAPVARWFSLLGYAATVLTLGLLMTLAIEVEAFSVPSLSMEPTLVRGDQFFVLTTGEHAAIQHGSVVVFWNTRAKTNYVKRVIGLPGDVVAWDGERLAVNDTLITVGSCPEGEPRPEVRCRIESFGGRDWEVFTKNGTQEPTGSWTVPEDTVFVMGDARYNSVDSRVDGFVASEDLVGTAVVRHFSWPRLGRIGKRL